MNRHELRERASVWLHGGGGWAGAAARTALLPAEAAFRVASRAYHGAYDRGLLPAAEVAVPVISVGNLTVGGTGKTPFVRWLVGVLLEEGRRPAVLHGGYAPDEPELHRRWHPEVPVFAERARIRAAGEAIARGADVLVLDDGFQHRSLARDVDVVLLAAEQWTPRPRLLPRGPWREPLSALRRAHAAVVTWRAAEADRVDRALEDARKRCAGPVAEASLAPAGWTRAAAGVVAGSPPGPALAVAGIAQPEAFVVTARAAGAQVTELLPFADHHAYTPADVARIASAAAGRPVVTTAKDAVKLRPLEPPFDVWVLEQRLSPGPGMEAVLASVRQALR